MTEYDPAGNPVPESYLLIDFDGTLIDSHSALYSIYLEFLRKHGITGSEQEFEHLKGPTIPEIVKILKDKHGLKGSPDELHKEYTALLKANYAKNSIVFPNALEAIECAREFGFRTALVTSAAQDLVLEALKKHHLDSVIDDLITSSPGEKGKPNPDIYLRALEELKIEPLDAIAIEDSLNGAQASLSANIPTMLLNPSPETLKQLESHPNKADLLAIRDWEDVIAFIEELSELSENDFPE